MKFKLRITKPRARNQAAAAVLDVNDMIGMGGYTASDMRAALDKRAKGVKKLTVRLCSDGGSITEGLAIYNMLKAHGAKVRVEITGIAASMGSVIAMAGDEIAMAADSWLMIHNPSGSSDGESKDMRKIADVLDKMRDQIVGIYAKRTGLSRAELQAMMKAETWMTAQEALAAGFCTEIVKAEKLTALKTRRFKHKPRALRATNEGSQMEPELLAKLGLEDDATLEDVLAAIDALQELAADAEPDGDDAPPEDSDDDEEPENEADDDEKPKARRRASARRTAAKRPVARATNAELRAALAENRRAAKPGKGKGVLALFEGLSSSIKSLEARLDGGERNRLIADNAKKFTPALEKKARKWPIDMLRDYVESAEDLHDDEGDEEPDDRVNDRVQTSAPRAKGRELQLTASEKEVAKLMNISSDEFLAFKKNGNKIPRKDK